LKPVPDDETAEAYEGVFDAYIASKIMAHVAADDFMKDNKVSFDLVRVHPGYTMGAHELDTARSHMFGGTNGALLGTALGNIEKGPKLTGQVLLEDVALAHVKALKPEVASNGDNIIVAGNGGVGIPWDDVADAVKLAFPKEVESGVLKPTTGQENFFTKYDVSLSEKAVGYKYSGAKEMVESVVGQYLALPA
jgi:nucleoside-diphosphate-sugar epimerase